MAIWHGPLTLLILLWGFHGYWQIMGNVARKYGSQTRETDDRKNLSKSTLIAAKYMRDQGRNLNNDILLVVASYNCGLGGVFKAMKKETQRKEIYPNSFCYKGFITYKAIIINQVIDT